MINAEELAICKRRGHGVDLFGDKWKPCKWCGTWLRLLRTVQEREDEPPLDEQDPLHSLTRKLDIKPGNDSQV
jgi:hypothetical protein